MLQTCSSLAGRSLCQTTRQFSHIHRGNIQFRKQPEMTSPQTDGVDLRHSCGDRPSTANDRPVLFVFPGPARQFGIPLAGIFATIGAFRFTVD